MKIFSYHQATGWNIATEIENTKPPLIGYCNSTNQWINDLWIEYSIDDDTLGANQYKRPLYNLQGILNQFNNPQYVSMFIHVDTYSQLPNIIQKQDTYQYNPTELKEYRIGVSDFQVSNPTDWDSNISFAQTALSSQFSFAGINNGSFYIHIYTKSETPGDNQSIQAFLASFEINGYEDGIYVTMPITYELKNLNNQLIQVITDTLWGKEATSVTVSPSFNKENIKYGYKINPENSEVILNTNTLTVLTFNLIVDETKSIPIIINGVETFNNLGSLINLTAPIQEGKHFSYWEINNKKYYTNSNYTFILTPEMVSLDNDGVNKCKITSYYELNSYCISDKNLNWIKTFTADEERPTWPNFSVPEPFKFEGWRAIGNIIYNPGDKMPLQNLQVEPVITGSITLEVQDGNNHIKHLINHNPISDCYTLLSLTDGDTDIYGYTTQSLVNGEPRTAIFSVYDKFKLDDLKTYFKNKKLYPLRHSIDSAVTIFQKNDTSTKWIEKSAHYYYKTQEGVWKRVN